MRAHDPEVKHNFVQANGLRIHYVERGSGPLVLLLHGFPEMWWSWRYQIGPIAAAGFRVVAPDLRGYNETDKIGPYDIDTLVADVHGLIKALGETRARVIGHDWGGAIAWHLAATRPETCERVAILNCPHPLQFRRALFSQWSQVKRSWYIFFFQLPWLPERLLARRDAELIRRMYLAHAKDRSRFGPDQIRPFQDAIQKPAAAKSMLGWYRALLMTALYHRARFKKYPIIQIPTLLIWAKGDRALDYEQLVPGTDRWAPQLELKTLDRCGHFVQSEQPEKVNQWLLDFLLC